jgi:H+/Cl- antiporter ClcA
MLAGTIYHDFMADGISHVIQLFQHYDLDPLTMESIKSFFSIASAPAYATVGAAATLGALFRAPLTSSMLMFELTQNHDIVLPVLLSTGLGGLFAELISQPREQW